jgi:ATP-dependent helicase/DNAse subunit B
MFKNIKAIVLPLKKEEKTTAQVCAQRSQCRVTHKRKDC